MKKYVIGNIVFVSEYTYEDGTKGTGHLFVIIDDNTAVSADYFGFIVTSQQKQLKYKYNRELKKDINNKLKIDSVVKCNQLYTIPLKNIVSKIGTVDVDDFLRFMEAYNDFLNNKDTANVG